MATNQAFVRKLVAIMVSLELIEIGKAKQIVAEFNASETEHFDDFLIEQGLVDREDVLEALSTHFGVPPFDVVGHFFDTNDLRKFPKDFLLRHAVVPRAIDGDTMVVVAAEPEKPGLESALRDFVSYDVVFEVGIRGDIYDAIKEYYDKSLTEGYGESYLREQEKEYEGAEHLRKDGDED